MNYQEIENKLVEFAQKKEAKDLPIQYVSIVTAVDFAIELVKNCSIQVVVGRSKQLNCDHQPKRFDKKHTSCKKCGKILQMKP